MSTVGLGIKEAVELANKSASNEPSGTFIELESGAKATQFRFSSEKLNNEPSGGLINNISSSTEVKAYLSNTGHIEVKLVGPNSEVGGEGERSLWKNGQFQDGFENELKRLTLNEVKNRNYSNGNGDVYPAFLNINDGTDMLDLDAIREAQLDQKNQKASSTPEIKKLKFGKVDKIIKRLSLRNLIYPIDADFGNTQDYMQINQFTYRAPNQDLFFGTRSDKDKTKNDFDDLILKGVPMGTPREDFLGLVKLPMPNSLADSNNVSWGADQLNALTAAVSSAVFGKGQESIDAFTGLLNSKKFKEAGFFGKAGQGIGTTIDLVRTALRDGKEGGKNILEELGQGGTNINLLGQAVAGSALLNILQFGISPESILARGQGVVPNNNLALLFNSPTLREFTFSWKMSPRSREEASRIRNIIRFFKQGMAPKKGFGTATGEASYFLGTPNVFDIIFKTTRDKYNILNENDAVLRIKTCACTGTAVNYTPDGMWNAYEQGQPVSVTLSLRFAELEPIFDTDYDDDEFNYSESRPDLRPVPIDAIGY